MNSFIPVFIAIFCISETIRTAANGKALKVLYAINAGGDDHVDIDGIHYEPDPSKIGTASDYGKHLLIINRVPEQDEILYKTERYHTSTFGYDIPLDGDGEYALVLKFCEVYFTQPNKKIFDVVLNRRHVIVSELDIFAEVGHGTAHHEYVFFTVTLGKLKYKEEVSNVRNNLVRLDFMKGPYDNPKINAFILLKGDVQRIPRLKPLHKDAFYPDIDDSASIRGANKKKVLNGQHRKLTSNEEDTETDEYPKKLSAVENEEDINDEFHELLSKTESPRKPSGPRQPDPYSMDDSTLLLPVFIAIGAFIPLLFCLCKL
uniref:Malectin domain-containing protein n=1 Tax=Glossina pallidipes TaxID=7398 RepID=A0A1A9ZPW6_GLOPL